MTFLENELTSGGITSKTKMKIEELFNNIRWTIPEEEFTRLGGIIDDDSVGPKIAGMSSDFRYKLGAILSTLTEVLRVQADNPQIVGLCRAAEGYIDALERDLEKFEEDYLILRVKESREESDIPEPVETPTKVEKDKPGGTIYEIKRAFNFEVAGLIGVLDNLISQRGADPSDKEKEELDNQIFAVADAISERSKSFINLVNDYLDGQPATQDVEENPAGNTKS